MRNIPEVEEFQKEQFLSEIAVNMLKSSLRDLQDIQNALMNPNTTAKALLTNEAFNKLTKVTTDIEKISDTLRCLQSFYTISK